MRRFVLPLGLLLACTVLPARADTYAQEVLHYDVAWGPISVGKAVLSFTRTPMGEYEIRADVKDSTALITLEDSWETKGKMARGKTAPLTPSVHRTLQRENDYKADKSLTFDADRKQVVFANRLNPADVYPVQPWNKEPDILTALYRLRLEGRDALLKGGERAVFGAKRPFALVWNPAKMMGEGDGKVLEVTLFARVPGKPMRGTWVVTLRDDGALTPVRIQASLKFGTFTAVLRER